MTEQKKLEIYRKALRKWGIPSQIHMCSEEMSELNKELMKALREGMNQERENLIVDEIADVLITVEQMIEMFKVSDAVEIRKEYKLHRLEKLIGEDYED